jgi:hypothetical protein
MPATPATPSYAITAEQVAHAFASPYGTRIRSVIDLVELFDLQLDPVPGSVYRVVRRRGCTRLIVEYDPHHPRVHELLLRACAYALRCRLGHVATPIPIGELAAGLMRFCPVVAVAAAQPMAAANQQHEFCHRCRQTG